LRRGSGRASCRRRPSTPLLNLLLVVPAVLQVFGRVLTRRSIETLVMLLALSVGALLFMTCLDVIRSRLLTAAAVALEKLLGPARPRRHDSPPGRL
jgi:ABC-type protease/lipase transport system fused ATPase/permease subunit